MQSLIASFRLSSHFYDIILPYKAYKIQTKVTHFYNFFNIFLGKFAWHFLLNFYPIFVHNWANYLIVFGLLYTQKLSTIFVILWIILLQNILLRLISHSRFSKSWTFPTLHSDCVLRIHKNISHCISTNQSSQKILSFVLSILQTYILHARPLVRGMLFLKYYSSCNIIKLLTQFCEQ